MSGLRLLARPAPSPWGISHRLRAAGFSGGADRAGAVGIGPFRPSSQRPPPRVVQAFSSQKSISAGSLAMLYIRTAMDDNFLRYIPGEYLAQGIASLPDPKKDTEAFREVEIE